MTNIVLNPDTDRLRNLRKTLKDQITILLAEKEDMIEHEESYLNALYLDKIGTLQYQIFVIKTAIAKLKLEMESIQHYINQNKAIRFDKIAEKIAAATEEYQRKIAEKEAELKDARDRLTAPTIPVETVVEVKRLYRKLVKRLHPDLNPNRTEQEKRLLQRVQRAYNIKDLDEMRALSLIVDDLAPETSPVEPPADELAQEVEHLKVTVDKLLIDIENLNKRFPFNQREFLNDKLKVEEKQTELKAEIDQLSQERDTRQQYVNSLKLWKPGSLN